MADWHREPIENIARDLQADPIRGLDEAEAQARLVRSGPNELLDRGAKNPWRILWEQFTATMVLILLAAAGLSALLQKWTEATSILAIVILFCGLGFLQEFRAERAMAALKKLTVPVVRVRRGGVLRELSARELVAGDAVLLEAGNMIPADARLVEAVNLRIQESALTGESEAVEKDAATHDRPDLALGDRRNMAYMGTLVTYGRGVALVVATGMRTELGRIAALIQAVKPGLTPLQARLDQLGKALAVAGVAVAALILGIGLLRGEPLEDMLLTAISVAVAVVPEGLPAVVTFTLALGAQRMLKRNALIRKLPAVETLGSVTTICSDKTGTLTENRMTVTVIDVAGHRLDLQQVYLAASGQAQDRALGPEDTHPELALSRPPAMGLLLAGAALCNDALLRPEPGQGRFHTLGDPTEGALLVAAVQGGLAKDALEAALPRVAELPFDSDRKRMTTVHRVPDARRGLPAGIAMILAEPASHISFTKGSVDGLLELAEQVWVDDHAEPLSPDWRRRIQTANDRMAQSGMRVLGVGFRLWQGLPDPGRDGVESALVMVGLFGMMDPPRAEVKEAVRMCQQAGIRPVMITGDHPLTARFIAHQLGIVSAGDAPVLTGLDVGRLSPAELEAQVERVAVFARVSPEHKLRIVEALQKRGHVVAMTGDGVNDAPALKRSDIGVAMGIAGTDVSKEASDMVLRDDNFVTIVSAVEEGRVIYDNVRRFVKFSIAGNVGKVGVMLLAPLLGINVALLPLQLLWLNLLTDGLLGLGLGVEPAESNIMRRPPQPTNAGLFNRSLAVHVAWVGALICALALGVGGWYYSRGLHQWQTMIFTTLAFAQMWQALGTRSMRDPLSKIGLFSNRLMVYLLVGVAALQMLAIYAPGIEDFFKVETLSLLDLAVSAALGSIVLWAIEAEKWLLRR